MVSDVEILDKKILVQPTVLKKVYLPIGDVSEVTLIGSSNISNKSTLSNVYHLPNF